MGTRLDGPDEGEKMGSDAVPQQFSSCMDTGDECDSGRGPAVVRILVDTSDQYEAAWAGPDTGCIGK